MARKSKLKLKLQSWFKLRFSCECKLFKLNQIAINKLKKLSISKNVVVNYCICIRQSVDNQNKSRCVKVEIPKNKFMWDKNCWNN